MEFSVGEDGDGRVQHFDGGFYMKCYLNETNFNYNKSLYLPLTYLQTPHNMRNSAMAYLACV
jgi:hypothetical protein